MIKIFPFINRRSYVHSSSVLVYFLELYPYCKNVSLKFNRPLKSNLCEIDVQFIPLDTSKYEATGCVDDLYFGVHGIVEYPATESKEDRNVSLQVVPRLKMPWVFTSYMKENCASLYDPTTHYLTLANVSMFNVNHLDKMNDFEFELKSNGSRLQGLFYHKQNMICKELLLVKGK